MDRIRQSWSLPRPTWIECLIVVAVIGIVVSLLIPGAKWAGSGSMRFPVRVFVFDAAHARPVSVAQIAILYGPSPHAGIKIDDIRDRFPEDLFERLPRDAIGLAGTDGTAVVHHEFSTGSNHVRPEPHVHPQFAWVVVAAQRYGTVVVPVRHDSLPTAKLREQKDLFVAVGLMPVK